MHFEVWTKLGKCKNLFTLVSRVWKSSVDFPSDITRICWSWFPSTNKGFLVTYLQILTLKEALEHQSNWSQENLRQITFDDWSKRIFPLFMKMFFHIFVHSLYTMSSWWSQADEIRSCITEKFLFASFFSSHYITRIFVILIRSPCFSHLNTFDTM